MASALIAWALVACGSGAQEGVEIPPDASADAEVVAPRPTALDVLFVLDVRPSMWEEQNALAKAAPAFLARLAAAGLDLRVAATTASVRSSSAAPLADDAGAFVHAAAGEHAPSCVVRVPWSCQTDAQCAAGVGDLPGDWSCDGAASRPINAINENGSVNSDCVLGCASDADCAAALGDTYRCVTPADGVPAGCVEPPPRDGCPADLPPVLDASHLAWARCLLAMGTEGSVATSEGAGLQAGLLALSRPDQSGFLRPDAPLLVVFSSDHDDCTREDELAFIDEESLGCTVHLKPVKELVSAYRALKADAAQVHVGGLVGYPATSGHDSPWLPDDCTRVHPTEACACPTWDEGIDCAEDLDWRLSCLDACLGKEELKPDHKCSKLIAEACRCYDHDANGVAVNADTPECRVALADEPAYRVACQLACYEAARRVSAVQPNTPPNLCAGSYGVARASPRYVDLLQAFGEHGFTLSVCAPDGMAGRLDDLATRLLETLGLPPG